MSQTASTILPRIALQQDRLSPKYSASLSFDGPHLDRIREAFGLNELLDSLHGLTLRSKLVILHPIREAIASLCNGAERASTDPQLGRLKNIKESGLNRTYTCEAYITKKEKYVQFDCELSEDAKKNILHTINKIELATSRLYGPDGGIKGHFRAIDRALMDNPGGDGEGLFRRTEVAKLLREAVVLAAADHLNRHDFEARYKEVLERVNLKDLDSVQDLLGQNSLHATGKATSVNSDLSPGSPTSREVSLNGDPTSIEVVGNEPTIVEMIPLDNLSLNGANLPKVSTPITNYFNSKNSSRRLSVDSLQSEHTTSPKPSIPSLRNRLITFIGTLKETLSTTIDKLAPIAVGIQAKMKQGGQYLVDHGVKMARLMGAAVGVGAAAIGAYAYRGVISQIVSKFFSYSSRTASSVTDQISNHSEKLGAATLALGGVAALGAVAYTVYSLRTRFQSFFKGLSVKSDILAVPTPELSAVYGGIPLDSLTHHYSNSSDRTDTVGTEVALPLEDSELGSSTIDPMDVPDKAHEIAHINGHESNEFPHNGYSPASESDNDHFINGHKSTVPPSDTENNHPIEMIAPSVEDGENLNPDEFLSSDERVSQVKNLNVLTATIDQNIEGIVRSLSPLRLPQESFGCLRSCIEHEGRLILAGKSTRHDIRYSLAKLAEESLLAGQEDLTALYLEMAEEDREKVKFKVRETLVTVTISNPVFQLKNLDEQVEGIMAAAPSIAELVSKMRRSPA